MKPGSLRLRLLLTAAISIVIALALAGAGIVYLYSINVDPDLRADFEASLDRLTAAIDPEQPLSAFNGEVLSDPRYAIPLSGNYWQVLELASGETARSRSLWDEVLEVGSASPDEITSVPGPEGPVVVMVRDVRLASRAGDRRYRLVVAKDKSIFDAAVADFRGNIAIALSVLAIAMVTATAVQIYFGLRPFEGLQQEVSAVRRGAASRLEGPFPTEIQPLVTEVNELLKAREESLSFARARAADLAHGIKTPLSVLQATAARIREAGDALHADTIEDLATEMLERADYQLRLSNLRLRAGAHVSSSLNDALLRSVAVLKKTAHGEHLYWDVQFAAAVAVNIDRHDLVELLGNLLENAAKWARSRVDVVTRREGATAVLLIRDDGPGIADEQIQGLGQRGTRLDERTPGHGLGLAIATEILTINGGSMTFSRPPEGGLQVEVRLALAEQR